jgi:arylsulfatase A-like enzyme
MLGKGGFFDGSFHIPLIIRDPRRGETGGTKVEYFTEAVDILPTLLDLLEEEVPPHLDGRSLKPFLDGEVPRDWRDAAHWEFDFRSIADGHAQRHFGIGPRQCNLAVIRTEKFKYVHFAGGLPPLLFDLEKDAGELNNVVDDPAYLPLRLELAERLLAWRAEHLDQSLALAELTKDGVAGHVAGLPLSAAT